MSAYVLNASFWILSFALLDPFPSHGQGTVLPHWIGVEEWAVQKIPREALESLRSTAKLDVFQTEQNPKDAEAWGRLSVMQFTFGQYEQAALSFQKLLRLQPTYPFAYTQYLQALYLSGDPDTPRWLLNRETGAESTPLPNEMLSAQLDYEADDFRRAESHLKRAYQLVTDPQVKLAEKSRDRLSRVILNNLIHTLRSAGDTDTANDYRIKLAEMETPESVELKP